MATLTSPSCMSWTTMKVAPTIRWKVSLHKNNCLYFNAGARVNIISKMLNGVSLEEDSGSLYLIDGEVHITTGPRESKVYSKYLCDMIREKYPGIEEFALIQKDSRYLLKPIVEIGR